MGREQLIREKFLEPGAGGLVRAFVVALAAWTLVTLGVLFFNPGGQSVLLTCMKAVGRSPECEAAQQAINNAWWWLHVAPLLTSIGVGYAAIVLVRAKRLRNRRGAS